jgi:hypothetical protein
MAQISIEGKDLVVEVQGMDKLWSLKSRITIPLAHVRGATSDPGVVGDGQGLKLGGSRIPGVIVAGTFRQDGEWVFWDVHDRAKAVVIELADETYARLVVEVADPRTTVELVERSRTQS